MALGGGGGGCWTAVDADRLVPVPRRPLLFRAFRYAKRTATLGFCLLICFQAAYALSGTVNIMLDHDIMDTQFLANTVLCLYLVFARDRDEAGGPDIGARV